MSERDVRDVRDDYGREQIEWCDIDHWHARAVAAEQRAAEQDKLATDYFNGMCEQEKRAEQAEQREAALREALERIVTCAPPQWSSSPMILARSLLKRGLEP